MSLVYSKIKYFDYIPAEPKKEMIMSRIGYAKGVTILDAKQMSQFENGIKLGKLLCRPVGAFVRVSIVEKREHSILLDNGIKFQSETLSRLLKDSPEVVLMSSTVGKDIIDRIFNEINTGNASMGIILDSVASQTADAALDWMMKFINGMLAKEGRKLTKHRNSPGYGDLQLSYQKIIFDTLMLGNLDMEITEKFMLVPEKSVIAIAGVEGKEIQMNG